MEFYWNIIIILLIIGLIVGIISSIAGIGGGVFFVSILTLYFYLPINESIDTSIFIIMISSGVAFITYLKDKRTDLKLSLIFAGFSILGSLICALFLFLIKIDSTLLRFIFAAVLLITGIHMGYEAIKSYKRQVDSINNEENKDFVLQDHDYKPNLKKSIPFFILAGFLAHLLGIGGGVINTPTLHIILGYPIHNATAISTSIIFFTAIFNTIVKVFFGKINYFIGIIIAIGSVLGSFIGAKISNRMPKVTLKLFVAVVLTILAIRIFF